MSREDTAMVELIEPVVADDDEDFGAELTDDELGDLLVREITIDGMCGVY